MDGDVWQATIDDISRHHKLAYEINIVDIGPVFGDGALSEGIPHRECTVEKITITNGFSKIDTQKTFSNLNFGFGHRWPSGKVSASRPEGSRFEPDSTGDPPYMWIC
ncbi:hypothetical protein AVEN_172712-1 [Araneus ventricosus]|uniref:Uncharacterized protein n=1 Tax=Araneus ventricosus TaxID=182803 RepID=A0A4Y2REV0_ARAVE|nr:hypothetical protein AVEN_172712-1 [Araneus ventricosus]